LGTWWPNCDGSSFGVPCLIVRESIISCVQTCSFVISQEDKHSKWPLLFWTSNTEPLKLDLFNKSAVGPRCDAIRVFASHNVRALSSRHYETLGTGALPKGAFHILFLSIFAGHLEHRAMGSEAVLHIGEVVGNTSRIEHY
jgi:hypothetical protein